MDESSLQALWQDQPVDRAVPSELKLKLTSVEAVDFARPTTQFRKDSAPAKSRWPFFAFASLAASVLLIGGYSMQVRIAPQSPPIVISGGSRKAAEQTAEQIESLLAECRTYSNPEAGMTDWPRALAACDKVLELEPIHREANDLVKRITVLQSCQADFEDAKELLAQGRVEASVERMALVHRGCESYFLRAMTFMKEPVREVKKAASLECLAYAKAGKWEVALPRCDVYARFACQTANVNDLSPPALMRVKLEGSFNPKTDWRPSDPTFLTFFVAREKLKVTSPWQCPDYAAFRAPPAAPEPALTSAEFAKRYKLPEFGRALTAYFQGDFQTAPVPLQKVIENMEKAEHHAQAKELLLDINNAINLYENGTTELTRERPDVAAGAFQRALAVDERIVLGSAFTGDRAREISKRVSFIRRSITESMGSATYEKGKGLADRKDFRAACRVWKLGLTFTRSNIDLLKAVTNVCTKRAQDSFERAQSCEQLKSVLDFAVDGDGFKERVEETLVNEGCK